MLLARPSLRGSVPLDVAYSSFMDNNELALALKEEELDKVFFFYYYRNNHTYKRLLFI